MDFLIAAVALNTTIGWISNQRGEDLGIERGYNEYNL